MKALLVSSLFLAVTTFSLLNCSECGLVSFKSGSSKRSVVMDQDARSQGSSSCEDCELDLLRQQTIIAAEIHQIVSDIQQHNTLKEQCKAIETAAQEMAKAFQELTALRQSIEGRLQGVQDRGNINTALGFGAAGIGLCVLWLQLSRTRAG